MASTLETCANTAARPASPAAGDTVYQEDTKQIIVWDGSAWKVYDSDGAAYQDSDITGLSPHLWLDGQNGDFYTDAAKGTAVTLDGRLVGCWADRSGNSFDFANTSAGGKPNVFKNIGTTNSTGLQMTTDAMKFTGTSSSEVASDCTVFMAHKMALHTQYLIQTTNSKTRIRMVTNYSTSYLQFLPFAGSPTFATVDSQAIADTLTGGICLIGIRKDTTANTTECFLNGGTADASTTAGSDAYLTDGVTLEYPDDGGGEGPNIAFEKIVFDSALSDGNMDTVFNYLSLKYGTTVTAVS